MRRLALLLSALTIAGCGGSKSTSSATTSSSPGTSPPISTTVPLLSTTTPTTPTVTTVTLTQTAGKTTTTGATNVRVPARFTIRPNGSVIPPTITIPPHLPVELIVVSNRQAHRIALRTTTLTVKPRAQAEALIDGLPVGSYPLSIDGTKQATLTIGGAPGP